MSAADGVRSDPLDWPARAPAIFGCAGLRLDAAERAFFRAVAPVGFILFARNVDTPAQVRTLVADLRDAVSDPAVPVFIDQEGGRVARLKPPHWRAAPAAALFGERHAADAGAAGEAARLNAELIGRELRDLGIDVDCLPLLDVRQPDADKVIGDRAFSEDPAVVAALGRAVARGLADGGCQAVAKHLPGHGRASVDSHLGLPRVTASAAELEAVDFAPFRALNDLPWGMTGHLVFEAFDPDRPATLSVPVIERAIRGSIGFDGALMTDDINMGALSGSLAERTDAALRAGCDLVLHCSGKLAEMQAVAAALLPTTPAAAERLQHARDTRPAPPPAPPPPGPGQGADPVQELHRLMASA
ncbi:MAG: beta-N-acetylhexosaminidase [Sneathiellaceae bacterium]